MIPSLSDFGTHANSLYPHLWDRCFFAFAPGLGNSSNKAIDWATGTASVFTNFSAARWGYDSGIPYLEGGANDSTNTRARFNWQSSNNPTSLAAWVYWTGQATNAMPFTVGGTDAYLFIDAATSIPNFTVNNGNGRATGVTAVAVNGWTHLCGVRNSSELRLYVNGVLDKTTAYPAGALNTGTAISVYSYQDGSIGSNYFAGRVDDAFAWSRPLSVEEIKLLSSQRNIAFVPRRQTRRIAWAAIEEVTGTAAISTAGATATASGSEEFIAASAASTQGSTSSASGSQSFAGAAVAVTESANCSASGLEVYSGSAAVVLDAASASAVAAQSFDGAGSASTDNSTAVASGLQSISGTGSAACGGDSSSSSGAVTAYGSAANFTEASSLAAVGDVSFIAVASATLATATSTSSGTVTLTGTASVTTQDAVSVATGGNGTFGDGSSQLDACSSTASGLVLFSGTASGGTASTATAVGLVGYTGTANAATSSATVVAAADARFIGSGSATTSCASSAAAVVSIVGSAVVTTANAESISFGAIPAAGAASILLGAASVSAIGVVIQTDLELVTQVTVSHCNAAIDSPLINAAVRQNVLRGRKIWQ